MASKWSPARGGLRSEAFPSSQECCPERPGAVKGAPLLGAAKRTLDGEDRSEMIAEEGKAGERSAKGGPPFWYPRPPPLTPFWEACGKPAPASLPSSVCWRSRERSPCEERCRSSSPCCGR